MLIDWFTVAAQAINFLILVWLLKRFLYKPVLAAIDEREKRIATQLQDSERKKAEALREQTDFLHKNEEFEQQRSTLLLQATSTANTERERLLEIARKDSEDLRSKLKKSAQDELENLNRKIGTLAVREVFSIARKILRELADVSLEQRMTEIFIHRLDEMNDSQTKELRASLVASPGPALVRSAFDLESPQKKALEDHLKPILDGEIEIKFETKADLISGIEVVVDGQKIAWNIADYLTSLKNSVGGLMESRLELGPVSRKAIPHVP